MEEDDLQSLHPAIRGLRVICRCNNVKYRTIEKAILAGATTISQVALKTTATTGHCGGTCTPVVQSIITQLTGGAAAPAAPEVPGEEDAWWKRPAEGGRK